MKKSSGSILKEKKVKSLTEKIKNARSLMVVSIKALPSRQFQDIKKSIRNEAIIKVEKKNILIRSIKMLGKESANPIIDHLTDSCAFVISDLEGYELAGILAKKKTPVFAKAGQIAPSDIEVKDGPTDLVPGPAISELGALGIQISVENGKIAIKASKVVVKEGQVIKENAAAILQKLGIQPFSVGLEPVALYDLKEEKVYTELKNLEIAKTNALGKPLQEIERCQLAEKLAISYMLKNPVLTVKHFISNMLKTTFGLYSSELLVIDSGGQLPPYSNNRSVKNILKRFLLPGVNNKFIIAVIYFEIIFFLFLLLGFIIFVIKSIFDIQRLCILAKVIPFTAGLIFLTLSCGYARLRLPIEAFLIILAIKEWQLLFSKKGE